MNSPSVPPWVGCKSPQCRAEIRTAYADGLREAFRLMEPIRSIGALSTDDLGDLLRLLVELEWAFQDHGLFGSAEKCPGCASLRASGHKRRCALHAAIGLLRGARPAANQDES